MTPYKTVDNNPNVRTQVWYSESSLGRERELMVNGVFCHDLKLRVAEARPTKVLELADLNRPGKCQPRLLGFLS
jgi:hypothetical protein